MADEPVVTWKVKEFHVFKSIIIIKMMRINEQLILEEDYDENYEPNEDGM